MTTWVQHRVLPLLAGFRWRGIASGALLLVGISSLLAAAIALRVALVTNPILEPELALGASLAFGAVGLPAVFGAACLAEPPTRPRLPIVR
jgi:hypothetical protein